MTRENTTREGDYIERKLMKVHFDFILLLALGAVVDSHVELRRANMEVKGHEKALMVSGG
jgi:hypothetical protein